MKLYRINNLRSLFNFCSFIAEREQYTHKQTYIYTHTQTHTHTSTQAHIRLLKYLGLNLASIRQEIFSKVIRVLYLTFLRNIFNTFAKQKQTNNMLALQKS